MPTVGIKMSYLVEMKPRKIWTWGLNAAFWQWKSWMGWTPFILHWKDWGLEGNHDPLRVKLVDPVETHRNGMEIHWDRRAIPVFTQSRRIVPKPKFSRADGIVPKTMIDVSKDTSVEDALKRTCMLHLKMQEVKVIEAVGVQGTRNTRKSIGIEPGESSFSPPCLSVGVWCYLFRCQ